MNNDDWKKLGKTLASKGLPLLGSLVGGPAGAALNSAGALIGSVIGGNADDPVAMLQALNAKPELIVELKRVELENEASLQRLAIQQEELYLKDVQNARGREVSLTATTGKRDINLYILAWIVVAGFLGAIVILAFADNPFSNNQAALLLLGSLAAGFGSVLNYFFGSSQGSKEKTSALSALLGEKKG